MRDLCIFRLKFENNFVTFDISILEFVKLQSFVQKLKFFILEPKMRNKTKKERKKDSTHFCKHLLEVLGEFPKIV